MNARIARNTLAALSLIALPLALTACGNKGPLILPPKDIPVDPSTLPPSTDNPNFAMPPAESDTGTEPVDDATVPAQPTEPAQPTKPTDDPAPGDDDGGRR